MTKIRITIIFRKPNRWPSFWDQFQTSVHSSDSLSDIDRFNYLQKYLCGPATACVSGLTLSSQNYKAAISILLKSFGKPQVLVSAIHGFLVKTSKSEKFR